VSIAAISIAQTHQERNQRLMLTTARLERICSKFIDQGRRA
jgi:hypothetical protein